jgi:formylglycine-generating enzyme required for sulfatase activity
MMVTKDRGLVIIDFGLASDEDAHGASLTMTGDLLGTPAYMSPEQWDAQRIRVDRRSDVYSLGVTLYECLALRRPFQAPSREQLYLEILTKEAPDLHRLNPAVSEDLRVIIACAMEKDADRRYQTALDFAEDLRRLREFEPIRARPVGPVGRLVRWSQRNPAVAALLAMVLLSLTGGILWTTFKNRELSEVNRELSEVNRKLERTTEEARRNAAEAQQNAIEAMGNARRAEAESAAKSLALAREQRALASVSDALNEKASALRELSEVNRELERTREEARWNAVEAQRNATAARENALRVTLSSSDTHLALEREQRALASVSDALKEKASALAEYERMADARRLSNAQRDAEAYWPVHPNLVPKLKAWQTKHEALFASLPDHERALHALRERALPYTEADRARDFGESLAKIPVLEKQGEELSKAVADAKEEPARKQAEEALSKLQSELVRLRAEVSGQKTWSFGEDVDLEFRHEALSALVAGLSAALDPKSGVVASIADRLEQSARIATETVTQHQALWTAAKERIAAHPAYAGLQLKPQTGLIPLGPDPTSGLEEFIHWQTHDWKAEGSSLPVRDTNGRMVMTAGRGVILVLIPGGTFRMGAQKSDSNKPNYDPEARPNESPVHEVPLAPYFLSKYEMTQGQWLRFTGENPSFYGVGWENSNIQKGAVDARHPVEQVSFDDGQRVLSRLGLELPTEAQWERAARAGASNLWAQTSSLSELGRFGNIAGAEAAPYFSAHTAAHRDPFVIHAPAGAFLANAYGLHDMTGNVWEWCRDGVRGYDESPREGDGLREGASRTRVTRGCCFSSVASYARVASRYWFAPSYRFNDLGFRPSRSITTD